jgi:hypothetical protein
MATDASADGGVDFVPPDFEVPLELVCSDFRLIPLEPAHNDADFAAWTSSMEHIHATPGFEDRPWPHPMPKEENLRDLENHAADFRNRRGFTYTVQSPAGETIGCLYIYPSGSDAAADADVRSWVRADHAQLDRPLYDAVSAWMRTAWPFETIEYAARPAP